ncbi:MAG: hypothetical protein F7C07_05430 [Desulfurococcales archaeon]|nr:hypothetical protein [Desulfurococcales archaeon]
MMMRRGLTVITVAIIVAATLALALAFASYYVAISSSVGERVEVLNYLGSLSSNLYYYVEWRIDNTSLNATRLYVGALNYNPSPIRVYVLALEAPLMNSTLPISVNATDPPQIVETLTIPSGSIYVLGPNGYTPLDSMLGNSLVTLHEWLLETTASKPYLLSIDVSWGVSSSAFIVFLVEVGGEYYEVSRLNIHR